MTALDSSWLKFWEFVSEFGFIMVIVGVVGEGTELVVKWIERRKGKATAPTKVRWLLPVETLSFAILVVGLGMEFLGSHNAMRIADAQNVRLNGLASAANERAANTESNNLVLRSNVVALELKIQPRTITGIQQEKFIKLLTNVPKCPIRIHCGNVDNETKIYASQLRGMLDAAGYNASDGVVFDLGNRVTTFHFSGVELDCVITNLQNISPPFPYMNDIEPATFKDVMKAFKEIGIDVMDGVYPLSQCYAKEVREELIKQGIDLQNPLGLGMVPGEITIILNEKAY